MGALDTMAASIVTVQCGSTGAGCVLGPAPRGTWILTCKHVVDDPKHKPAVVVREGKRFRRYLATVVATDEDHDLALLCTRRRIPAPGITLAKEDPDLYEDGYIMGAHDGMHGIAGRAVVCGVGGSTATKAGKDVVTFTGPVAQGMSGGILCDVDGELWGVPSHAARDGEMLLGNIGFAVPVSAVRAFLARHKALPGGA